MALFGLTATRLTHSGPSDRKFELTHVLLNRTYLRGVVGTTKAARMGSALSIRRICLLSIGGLLSFLFDYQAATASEALAASAPFPSNSAAKAAQPVACPSQDFSVFLKNFFESAKLQRAFTRLPLAYGQVDQELVGTGKPDFSTRLIQSFRDVPLFDKADGGRIFPSAAKLAKKNLKLEPVSDVDKNPAEKTAKLYAPDTGFRILFKFRKMAGCWFLLEVNDKSV